VMGRWLSLPYLARRSGGGGGGRGRRTWDVKTEMNSAVDVSAAKSGSVSSASLAAVKELRFRIAPVPTSASVRRKKECTCVWCVER
jgi:hypothetical protein